MRILIIDNDRVFTEPLIWRLRRENHDVTFVPSVEEALAALEQNFDVAILDLMMPRGPYDKAESDSGRKTGALLLKDMEARQPQLPVIILTVRPDEEIKSEVERHACVKSYLVKPVTPSEVLHTIGAAIGSAQGDNA